MKLVNKYGFEKLSFRNVDSWLIRRGLAESVLRGCNFWKEEQQKTNSMQQGRKLRLLDVGCGAQPYRPWIEEAGLSYTGIDWSNSIHAATDPQLITCDLSQQPWPIEDGQFDAVLCTEVLEHQPEPAEFLAECARIVAPGGTILLTTPLVWPEHELPYDFYRYTGVGLQRLLENSGFRVEQIWSRGGWHAALSQLIGVWSYYAVGKPYNYVTRVVALPVMKLLEYADRRASYKSPLPLTLGYSIIARRKADSVRAVEGSQSTDK